VARRTGGGDTRDRLKPFGCFNVPWALLAFLLALLWTPWPFFWLFPGLPGPPQTSLRKALASRNHEIRKLYKLRKY